MKILGIIPARSGSKGLKDKNIKVFAGKPLLAYSIIEAEKSGLLDCIHVSTDSENYKKIAEKWGADVPFLRSEEMSSDKAGTWDAVIEVLEKYEERGKRFDTVMLLQPTSPLRKSDDIKNAVELYEKKQAKAIISVCEMDHSPLWSNTLDESFSMDGFEAYVENVRRQDLPIYYRMNGAIYLVDVNFLKESQSLCREGCYAYIMEKERSIDIDDQFDFDIAEYILTLEEEGKK